MRRMKRLCMCTLVHYEQTVRLICKGNEWPAQGEIALAASNADI